jgi:phenylacetate-coenzyme A ligase PaaK-like adenylate-forming protein
LSADYVPAAVVHEISRAWGCAVFNHYGMTEMGLGAAVDCRALSGYHIREADLYFEIIDSDSGLPVPDGEMGEVVFSTLTRKGMPLIRYRTGDLSRFIPEPCPCGTVLKRLEWVRGRLEGAVSLANGSRLSMADLDEALFPLTGILNFQVVIDRENGKDQLNLTIYGRDETTGDVARQARRALENVTAVRAALDMGALTVASVGTGMENWISTGSIKRKILDRREEM